ncbi:hypothetical protein MNV49_002524 [Pseudohyphozyma bogoriensis]|nr:hypothetical protein MNV49_002524 [Pseudohyphozyma bogoriensis]
MFRIPNTSPQAPTHTFAPDHRSAPTYDPHSARLFANFTRNPPYEPSPQFLERQPSDWVTQAMLNSPVPSPPGSSQPLAYPDFSSLPLTSDSSFQHHPPPIPTYIQPTDYPSFDFPVFRPLPPPSQPHTTPFVQYSPTTSASHTPLPPAVDYSSSIYRPPSPIRYRTTTSSSSSLPSIARALSSPPRSPSPALSANSAASSSQVRSALTSRFQFLQSPHPLPHIPPRPPATNPRPRKKGAVAAPLAPAKPSTVLEVDARCWECGTSIARLKLKNVEKRGEEWPQVRAAYRCFDCAAPLEGLEDGGGLVMETGHKEDFSYKDTLSAAVDALEGMNLVESRGPLRPQPLTKLEKDKLSARDPSVVICDACDRPLGRGTVSAADPRQSLPKESMPTEAVCTRCDELYKICTDCGGGGGRLSAGQWRCKELFTEGRKTCRLSHLRAPLATDRTYTVYDVRQFQPGQRADLEQKCRASFFNSRLGALARPEQLERGDGLASTFLEAEKTTIDAWSLMLGLFEEDTSRERSMARYLTVHWAAPHRRKAHDGNSTPMEDVLVGFLLVEHDLLAGTVFFAAVSPWQTSGKSYEATTLAGEATISRIRADLAARNAQRVQEGLEPYPRLACQWTLSPFRRDSKYNVALERRGYTLLSELAEWPGISLQHFPPYREIFIPTPFVKGFKFYVRPYADDNDLGSPPKGAFRKKKRDEVPE